MIILDPTDHEWNKTYRYNIRFEKNQQGYPDGWEITWKDGSLDFNLSFTNEGVLVHNLSRASHFHIDTMVFDDDGKLRSWKLYDDEYYQQYETEFDDKGLVLKTDDDFWGSQVRRRTDRLNADRNRKE